MSKKKKEMPKFLIWIQYSLFLVGIGIIRALPLSVAYAVGKCVASLLFVVDRKHAGRAVRHVLHSGIRTNRRDARKLAYASFIHMIKVFVEIVKFDQIVNKDNIHEYIKVSSDSCSRKMMSPESTCQIILATGHLGNWELAGGTHSELTGLPMTSIMRPLANKKIGNYFYTKRNGIAHETVSKEKGVKPLLNALRAGKTIAIVADQHASHKEGIELTFFGHPARTHMTPALLHLKTSVPIFTAVVVRKDDDFHFMITAGKLIRYTPTGDKEKDIRAITEAYSASYEKLIRRFPDQWLWAHRRWLDCGRHASWSPDHFETVKRNQTAEND